MTDILVFIVGLGAVATALYVILARHPIYGAISLVGHILCVALLYLGLGSPVLAVLQVLIYAGAIIVLFVYACMYVGPESKGEPVGGELKLKVAAAALVTFVIFIAIVAAIAYSRFQNIVHTGEVKYVEMTRRLFSQEYVVPFEAVSILLLVAIIGAIYLSRAMAGKGPERKAP